MKKTQNSNELLENSFNNCKKVKKNKGSNQTNAKKLLEICNTGTM